jgi:hypothetical protein
LHNFQLPVISGLESAGIVENIFVMTRKGEFEIDVMFTTLYKQDPHDQPSQIRIGQPNLHRRFKFNLDR